ncbi:hypothetical protein V8E51_009858 [Hyaloscypha variabilis]
MSSTNSTYCPTLGKPHEYRDGRCMECGHYRSGRPSGLDPRDWILLYNLCLSLMEWAFVLWCTWKLLSWFGAWIWS